MNIIYYSLIINIISFITYGLGKYCAKKHLFRVSERTLILLSIFGGMIGSLLGMYIFHHKTRKWYFKFIIIIMIFIWTYIIVSIY